MNINRRKYCAYYIIRHLNKSLIPAELYRFYASAEWYNFGGDKPNKVDEISWLWEHIIYPAMRLTDNGNLG